MALAPSRAWITFQEATPLLVTTAPTSYGPWSFRDPGRSLVWRFFAHLLVRLLVLAPLPPQFQVASVLFPVSMLWPLVRPAVRTRPWRPGESPGGSPRHTTWNAEEEEAGDGEGQQRQHHHQQLGL